MKNLNPIRFALPVDNQSGKRFEEIPAFMQSNQRVKVRQSYNGAIVELVSQEGTKRFPKKERDDIQYACLWLRFYFIRFYGPLIDDQRSYALNWQIEDSKGNIFLPEQDKECCTTYSNDFVPTTEWKVGELNCKVISVAPVEGITRRRGIVYSLRLENNGLVVFHGKVRLQGPGVLGETSRVSWDGKKLDYSGNTIFHDERKGVVEGPEPAFMVVEPYDEMCEGNSDDAPWLCWQYDLEPGEQKTFSVSIGLGATQSEAFKEANLIKEKTSTQWLDCTTEIVSDYLGNLEIVGGEWWREFLINHIYQGNGALNCDNKGRIIGGTIAPDYLEDTIQEADIFHGMQVHHWVNPELFKKFILFFFDYLTPPPAVKFNLNTQPGVEPAILLEMYYKATNDKNFFFEHPELCAMTQRIFERLMPYKAPDRWLFLAEEVSDGHPVTRYDLCTNIRIWQAYQAAGRVMSEVYGEVATGNKYIEIAKAVRKDIFETMTMQGPFGLQFAAGTNLPGEFMFFDGEDNVVTLAPYYGFCEFTEERWRNYCKTSFSPYNPTYDPGTGGQAWYDDPNIGEFSIPVTSPWAAARVQSAVTRKEALEEFRRIEWLADVDTSFYWWPLPNQVRTNNALVGHSLWMSGGVGTVILTHYLGINLDVPTQKLIFKPWLPWRKYSWDKVRLGNARFSYQHIRGSTAHTSIIKNNNEVPWQISFGFYIPKDTQCRDILINGSVYKGQLCKSPFYEDVYIELEPINILPGETVKATVYLS
jgi:hypothetical protein